MSLLPHYDSAADLFYRADVIEWLSDDFGPAFFDMDEVNAAYELYF